MRRAFFVTGTDTGVGKTLVAVALLTAGARRGCRTAGIKPIAAGCEMGEGGLINADAQSLKAAANVALSYAQVNPIALEPPIAPHIAARSADMALSAASLAAHCEAIARGPIDLLVVEGAGGWLVPLNDTETLADVCAKLTMPVILVVGMKLGCLNHALLTVAAIDRMGLPVAGWVANCMAPEMAVLEENLATLRTRLPGVYLGCVPYLGTDPQVDAVIDHLSLDVLFER